MSDLKYTVDIDTSRGINSLKALRTQIAQTEGKFDKLNNSIKQTGSSKNTGGILTLKSAVKGLAASFVVKKIVDFGTAIVDASRKLEEYNNKLRIITTGEEDLARIQGILVKTAIDTRTSYSDTINLFSKLRVATDHLGTSEEDVIEVTNKLSKALQVAGADGITSTAVIRQFGQAMASGTVRGDEFRSIAEGLGPALAIIGKETGITIGELRNMSQSGELTAEVMFEMIKNSEILQATFANMEPIISTMETAFSDAFDRMLFKLGETTTFTQKYKDSLSTLTRMFDKVAETSSALVNMSADELFNGVYNGSTTASAALQELGIRLVEANDKVISLGAVKWIRPEAFATAEALRDSLKQMYMDMLEYERDEEALALANKKTREEYERKRKALMELSKGFEQYIALGRKYEKMDFGTPMEKLIAKRDKAVATLEKLTELQRKSNESGFNDTGIVDYTAQIKAAGVAVKDYNRLINDKTGIIGFDKFYQELVDGVHASSAKINYAKESYAKLKEQLDAGTISTEEFALANAKLDKILDKQVDATLTKLSKNLDDYVRQTKEATTDLETEYNKIGKTEYGAERYQKELDLAKDLANAKRKLEEQRTPANSAEIDSMLIKMEAVYEKEKAEQLKWMDRAREKQRSFATGWKDAFAEYKDDATNAAEHAARIFDTATKGMEDSIVDFVKTGKFEFKDLASTILEEMLRIQIQKSIMNIGGAAGSLFSGMFATGGMIPAGRYGVVGEAGPELVEGPATVTPAAKLGGGNVTYNINAVDASSFKQMVARDPGFLFAVTEQGRKRATGGR